MRAVTFHFELSLSSTMMVARIVPPSAETKLPFSMALGKFARLSNACLPPIGWKFLLAIL
jgi:hypothetical protein